MKYRDGWGNIYELALHEGRVYIVKNGERQSTGYESERIAAMMLKRLAGIRGWLEVRQQ